MKKSRKLKVRLGSVGNVIALHEDMVWYNLVNGIVSDIEEEKIIEKVAEYIERKGW